MKKICGTVFGVLIAVIGLNQSYAGVVKNPKDEVGAKKRVEAILKSIPYTTPRKYFTPGKESLSTHLKRLANSRRGRIEDAQEKQTLAGINKDEALEQAKAQSLSAQSARAKPPLFYAVPKNSSISPARAYAQKQFDISPYLNQKPELSSKGELKAQDTFFGTVNVNVNFTATSLPSSYLYDPDVSPYRYINGIDTEYVFAFYAPIEGATSVSLHFTFLEMETFFGSPIDKIIVEDQTLSECGRQGGTRSDFWIDCPGDTAYVRVYTDGSVAGESYYGFSIDKFEYTWEETVNRNPTAILIADRTRVTEGEEILLDGSASSDPDFDEIVKYQWTFDDGSAPYISQRSGNTPANPAVYYAYDYPGALSEWREILYLA